MPFSIADNHDLKPGEVIVSVMDHPVTSVDQVVSLFTGMMKAKAPYVAFLVANDNGTRWVPVPISAGVP